MDHSNSKLISEFYQAFAERDAETMGAFYDDHAIFSDAVFPKLVGERIRLMWKMLCERGQDLTIVASNIRADDTSGQAHWEATYTFSRTGRLVNNSIDSRFEFRNGKIIKQTDSFDFAAWSRQALGFTGWILGRTSFLKSKVQNQAALNLAQYEIEQQSPLHVQP